MYKNLDTNNIKFLLGYVDLQNYLIKQISLNVLHHIRGVVLSTDGKSFIITYGKQASLIKINVNTLLPITNSEIQSTFISGSHLYNISRERILLKLN